MTAIEAVDIVWLWSHEDRAFGMFVPFLGVSFGTNILLSALNVVYEWLDEKQRATASEHNRLMAKNEFPKDDTDAIEKRRSACRKWTRRLRNIGRFAGIVVAFLIACALFLIHPSQPMNGSGVATVLFAGSFLPVWVGVMVLVNRAWNSRIKRDINDRSLQLANRSGDAPEVPAKL